ncbi:MAG: hypothetical protein H8D22_07615 [Candidatus Cloacimonetes bacterium]|nr:hypothetical protein [Candidatus Cloacimonadota bacterium]
MKTLLDTLATKTRRHKGLNLSIFGVLVPLWLILPANLLGIDFDPQGFADTYHAVGLNGSHNFLSSRTRLRFEMWITGNDASLFASMNAINNNVIKSNSGLELREAFIDYFADNWDVRIGRQLIIWGKADGLAITDIISPKDYTEFIAQDFDDIRLPVDALKWRLLFEQANIEFLWLPVFKPAILPSPDLPWAFKFEYPQNFQVIFEEPIEPDLTLKNSEVGGKLSFYLHGIDFAFSSFYTWDDLPTIHKTISTGDTIVIHYYPEHHRLTFIGVEFSRPLGDFILRGEGAFYKDKYFEPADILSESLFKKNSLDWLLGIDWTPGNYWMITAQLADDFILNYNNAIKNDEHTMLATLHISKKFLRQTLELSAMGYYGINDKDFFVRTGVDYALTDELHILSGIDIFGGNKGIFGQFDNNDEVWIKAKYNF